jgi:hypothetical protein
MKATKRLASAARPKLIGAGVADVIDAGRTRRYYYYAILTAAARRAKPNSPRRPMAAVSASRLAPCV